MYVDCGITKILIYIQLNQYFLAYFFSCLCAFTMMQMALQGFMGLSILLLNLVSYHMSMEARKISSIFYLKFPSWCYNTSMQMPLYRLISLYLSLPICIYSLFEILNYII